jgi:uncharacterized protein (UPF0303 family)
MALAEDMTKLVEQEKALVFERFDEEVAFTIGRAIKGAAEARDAHLAIEVRLWDRQLFFFAMPGTTADNADWIRRKSNCVRRYGHPSYALTLRQKQRGSGFVPDDNADPADYAAHGGSFPINVVGAGIIGAITVSGVPGRNDHGFVVAAIAGHLGLDAARLALAEE